MNKPKIAVFPGSFDPITIGHESIIKRAIPLFDKIIVVVGINADKKCMFSLEQRIIWLQETFNDCPTIEITTHQGLTVDFCKEAEANYILRGLRTSADFEFERSIGQTNKAIHPDIDTVFMLTLPEHTYINSSIVRDVFKNGGDVSNFIPANIDLMK
jgi:pantetheine-phosphate adenylyltransferase